MIQFKSSLITKAAVVCREKKNHSSCFQVFKTGGTVVARGTSKLILREPELRLVSVDSDTKLSFVLDVLLLALKSCLEKAILMCPGLLSNLRK